MSHSKLLSLGSLSAREFVGSKQIDNSGTRWWTQVADEVHRTPDFCRRVAMAEHGKMLRNCSVQSPLMGAQLFTDLLTFLPQILIAETANG